MTTPGGISPNSSTHSSVASPDYRRSDGICLVVIIVAFLILACVHVYSTPFGGTGYQDAPDEAAHVSYVLTLAAGQLPDVEHKHGGIQNSYPDYEWHQPPLYYLLARPFAAGGPVNIRFLSVLFGCVCIVFTFRIGRILRPDCRYVPIVAAGLAALIPGHVAILSAVNNDSLLEAGFAGTILAVITFLKGPASRYGGLITGLLLSVSIMTKASAILLIPIVIAALVLAGIMKKSSKEIAAFATQAGVTVLVLCSWWFVRNMRLYHEILPLTAFKNSFGNTALAADVVDGKLGLGVHGWPEYWSLLGNWCFKSFWAVYGTARSATVGMPLFLPDGVYQLAAIISLAAGVGMIRLHIKRKVTFDQSSTLALYLLFAALALVLLSYIGFTSTYFQSQGRYLYPAMSSIAILLSMGWLALFSAKYQAHAAAGLLAIVLMMSLVFDLQTSNRGGQFPPAEQQQPVSIAPQFQYRSFSLPRRDDYCIREVEISTHIISTLLMEDINV